MSADWERASTIVHMDYVDWVHNVMRSIVSRWRRLGYSEKEIGIDWHDVVPELGFEHDARSAEFQGTTVWWAMIDSLKDLEEIGWLEAVGTFNYRVTSRGEMFPEGDITTAWQQILDVPLGDDEASFLEVAIEASEERHRDHVLVCEVEWQDVFAKLGWSGDGREDMSRARHITRRLEDSGLIRRSARGGGAIRLTPRYVGVVRATRRAETEWVRTIRQLVEEWETTTVEFKRELNLKRSTGKAKFVSRVMGLATTRSSGRRFFVVGFDNDTHEFVRSVDPKITQEQLEQILHAYCQPPIRIKYARVPYLSGEVGIVEVFRNPEDIPYRVTKELGGQDGIKVGDMYVRHGSRTEPPSEAELLDLVREGEKAREQSVQG